MSIVKRLVDMMQGTIEIESELGRGTKTSIALDLEQRTAGEGESEESDEAVKIDLKGKRILLVDDNELNREILEEVLLDNGLLIDKAENGLEALSAVKEHDPGYYHFILMDIEMPEMDGFEATLRIRKLPNRIRANTPIIAFTANAVSENRDRAFAVGMDGFLVKPVNTSRLLASLVKFL